MKFGTIMGLILATAIFFPPCLALHTNVYSLSERNLSIDLGPGFEVTQKKVDNCSGGYFVENLMIAKPNSTGVAVLQIMDLYNGTLKALNSSVICEQWVQGMNSATLEDGGKSAGNWSAVDVIGQNVTIHMVSLGNTSMKVRGDTVNFGAWNIEKDIYVGMLSFFDKNTTKQMVKTLALS
jgi:hypothetical protein